MENVSQSYPNQLNARQTRTFYDVSIHCYRNFPRGKTAKIDFTSTQWKETPRSHSGFNHLITMHNVFVFAGSVLRQGDDMHSGRTALQLDVQRTCQSVQQHWRGWALGANWVANSRRWVPAKLCVVLSAPAHALLILLFENFSLENIHKLPDDLMRSKVVYLRRKTNVCVEPRQEAAPNTHREQQRKLGNEC